MHSRSEKCGARVWKRPGGLCASLTLRTDLQWVMSFGQAVWQVAWGGRGVPRSIRRPHLLKMHKLRKAYAIEMSKRYAKTISNPHCIRLALSPLN